MDITGLGEVATAAKGILGMIFPDKTEEDKAKLAAALSLISAQTDIDKAEAMSSDPLQHWRGGLGWTCVAAYAWNFVLRPMTMTVGVINGHNWDLPVIDIAPLATLTIGMLGLGGMHVAERINGSA
jgi:hypothetical protein